MSNSMRKQYNGTAQQYLPQKTGERTITPVVGAGELESDIASITKSPFVHVDKFFISNPKLLPQFT